MSQKVDNVMVDLDRVWGVNKPTSKIPSDPLDSALLDADAQLGRELKRTTVKRMLTEEQNKLNLMQKDMDGGEEKVAKTAEQPEVDPKVFQMIANLPPEQQEKALEVYTTMQAARGMKGEAAYMPLILRSMENRPNSNASDLVTIVTKVIDVVDNARVQPQSSGVDKLADALVTVATQNKGGGAGETAALITAIADVVRGNPNQAPAADPTATAIGMLRDLKDLGFMTPQQAAPGGLSDETRIRLAEIARDTDFKLAELGLKKDTELRKLDNDEKRTNAISGVVERAAKVVGRAIGEGENEGMGQPAGQAAPAAQLANVQCPSCNKTIAIPNPAQARDVTCPHCGSLLHWDGKA